MAAARQSWLSEMVNKTYRQTVVSACCIFIYTMYSSQEEIDEDELLYGDSEINISQTEQHTKPDTNNDEEQSELSNRWVE